MIIESLKAFAASYDWRLVTRDDFDKANDVPDGIRERVAKLSGYWVLYDPLDDTEGYTLVGNDPHAIIEEFRRDRLDT